MARKSPTPSDARQQVWPIVDNAHIQLRPPAAAGGPYEHKFVDGACRVCGYAEGGIAGCPWNVGTVYEKVPVGRRGR